MNAPHHFGWALKTVFLQVREQQVFFKTVLFFNDRQAAGSLAQPLQRQALTGIERRVLTLHCLQNPGDHFIFQPHRENGMTRL